MKKLIYIANVRIPTEKAHGLAIMKMCEAFAENDLDVSLIIPWRFNRMKSDSFEYYGVKRNFEIKKLFSLDILLLGRLGFLIQWVSFAKIASLYAVLNKADIYYGRDELSLWLISLYRKNTIWEAHTAKNNWYVRSLIRRNKLVVISRGLAEFYRSIGAKEVLVAPSGVDLTPFEAITGSKEELREQLDLPLDKRIVAYIGKRKSMGEDKGVEELEKTLNSLTEENPEIYPLIVSEVPPQEVPLYMKAVDVLVMNYPDTEHYARYMSPLKMFEYMASGTPIVTADLPSIREILNEEMAYFFKHDSTNDLTGVIGRVLDNQQETKNKASRAQGIVRRYSWSQRAENILNLINR